ncbi:MAG: ABC transporter ATP-binding protein [Comamonadaceae bacterium]|nr:MAG: ABC transporter ATP-binding protein [Comamonadaceae bacterium]
MSAVLTPDAAPLAASDAAHTRSRRKTQLSIEGLHKRYPGHVAIHGLDLTTREGEFISVLGPSGCGKTTTLRCVAGFEYPEAGRICIDGEDITNLPPEKRDIGMVFQNYALFPHLNVRRNLAFGLEMRGVPRADIERRVEAVLGMVQLGALAERFPRQLSGGQQQRVALARALVIEPRLLLLDEPLANLDAVLREDMRVFIRDLQRRVGITTLYVTHDQSEAMVMSDRVAVMLGGTLQQFDEPEAIYLRPSSVDVARFIGRSNLIEGQVGETLPSAGRWIHHRIDSALGPMMAMGEKPRAAGSAVHLALRPEAIHFRDDGPYAGRVMRSYFLGSTVEHLIECGGQTLLVQTPPAQRQAEGHNVRLAVEPGHAWIIPS